jgi:hypothetical protein
MADPGRSRLHLAIGSRTYLRAFDLWVEEHPRFRGRAERSDSIIDEHQSLVESTLNTGIDTGTHPFAVIAAEDALAANERGTPVLEVRPGGWVVDTTSSIARAAVTAAVMTAVMYAGGVLVSGSGRFSTLCGNLVLACNT